MRFPETGVMEGCEPMYGVMAIEPESSSKAAGALSQWSTGLASNSLLLSLSFKISSPPDSV